MFGYVDQEGHAEVTFEDVRVPASNLIANEGDGFLISQARLGPGRIHHCMRAIGAAERALELMCPRAASRVTFGQPVASRANIQDWIAESRIEIEMARLLTLKAAWLMDTVGNKHARTEISAIKVAAPNVALRVVDRAIQVHGGGGVSRRLPAGDDVRPPADAAARRRAGRDPQAHDRPPRAEGCISLPAAMRTRGRLSAVVAISTAVWCVTAAGATAKTLCVNDPACVTGGGTAEDTIADALDAATSAHSIDPTNTVEIGPGTYVGAYAFTDSNQVTIEGAGAGRTVLQFGGVIDIGLYLHGNSADSVSSLSIVAASGTSPGAAGIQIDGGQVDHVAVDMTADGSQAEGVTMGAGRLTNSTVTVENAPGATAVLSFGTSVLADDTLSGGVGYSNGSGTSFLTRTRISAGTDGVLCHVTCVASSSLIKMGPGSEAGVLATGFSSSCGSVTASNLTIVGAAIAGAGARCGAAGKTASLTIDSSVLRGATHALEAEADNGSATATVTPTYDDYDPASDVLTGAGSRSIAAPGTGWLNADPRFLNPTHGDYRIPFNSPLIDAGNPAGPGFLDTDLAGLPRVVHGRMDIGAYEYQRLPPTAAITLHPASVPAGAPVHFDGRSSHDLDPGEAISYAWSFGDGATATGPTPVHSYSTPGTRTVRLTVTDPTGLSSIATVKVTVTPAPPPVISHLRQSARRWRSGSGAATISRRSRPPVGTTFSFRLNVRARVRLTFRRLSSGRAAGTLSFSAHTGTDRVTFDGRLRRGVRLAAGRYSVTIVARTSRKKSAPRSLRFTIVS